MGVTGFGDDSWIRGNNSTWGLDCSAVTYSSWDHNSVKIIYSPAPSTVWNTVAVSVDWSAGTASFYRISSDTLSHIHTFHSTFTDSVHPPFRMWSKFTYGLWARDTHTPVNDSC